MASARSASVPLPAVIVHATKPPPTARSTIAPPPPSPPGPPISSASRLTNVSVRSAAGSNSGTLIVGFAINGTGAKQILVRGIGPTLAQYGVNAPVADPDLALYGNAGDQLGANDDWGGTATLANAFARVGAFPLPTDSTDAALLTSLPGGTYTAQLEPKGGTGIALVEAYDEDPATSPARLVNVSARSFAGTGENVLTVGFAITGDQPGTVLIRAIGPSLSTRGVQGVLSNPVLNLFSADGTNLGTNDDWWYDAGWASVFSATGAFALTPGSLDSALVVMLPPGSYTAQASGADNGTGVALIEVYQVTALSDGSAIVLQPQENTPSDTFTADPVPDGSTVSYPKVTSQASPAYPYALLSAGITGEASIDFIVAADGTVTNAMILHTTDIQFGQASLTAVRQWRFTPGTVNGAPEAFLMEVPIIFTLNG